MNDASTSTNPALVRQLAQLLLAKKLIMATAESCTGGWIAQSLTALPGSSDWFDTGFVTYSNEAKQRLLEVPSSCLAVDGPGAVSAETVLAMTRGAIANSRANVAVAVSGIAGPDGGSEDKPVGTVCFSVALAGATEKHTGPRMLTRTTVLPGNRTDVRERSTTVAMHMLRRALSGEG